MNTNRLLFEGVDDKHVVKNLLFNHNLDIFDYKEKEGIDRLIGTLHEEIEATDWNRMGIIVDADVDVRAQWSRVTSVLAANGFEPVPSAPSPRGTIMTDRDSRKIGLWIMPDNSLQGSIEDFVAGLIRDGDVVWPRADRVVDEIPDSERRFKASHVSKAKIHTWLAWQEEPGTRMGAAFTKRYLDPTRPQASAFVNWIRSLLA